MAVFRVDPKCTKPPLLFFTLVFPLGEPIHLTAVCAAWFASTSEALSSLHKCFPHRVTDLKQVTKRLKACHHSASCLGAQILCWILLGTCLSSMPAFLHFPTNLCENHFQEKTRSSTRTRSSTVKVFFHFSH